MKLRTHPTAWRLGVATLLATFLFGATLLSGCAGKSGSTHAAASASLRAPARAPQAQLAAATKAKTPPASADTTLTTANPALDSVPLPDSAALEAQPRVSLADAAATMTESGDLYRHVLTRTKPGGVHTTPKYPDKAWEAFMAVRVPEGQRKLPDRYREEALEYTLAEESLQRRTAAAPSWTYIGPDGSGGVQPSGRLIELEIHPSDPNIVYAAAASGGLYKSTNGATTWTNITDAHLPSIGMGSVGLDPFSPSIVYCGLGEGQPGSFYEPYGGGIYKSTDAGATWNFLSASSGMQYVTDIQVTNSSNLVIATSKGQSDGTGAGLWRSTDGGATWVNMLVGGSFFDVAVNPDNRSNVVVSLGYTNNSSVGSYARIYYSTDGGMSFNESYPSSLWDNTNDYRIELTFSTSNRIYALFAATDSSFAGLLRSDDGGATWTQCAAVGIPTSGDYKPGQMTYNCAIGSPPGLPTTVYLGSNLRMYKSIDSGQNFVWITDWAGNDGLPYMHADHHTLRFANSTTVYCGNDGGFFRSTNGGTSWTELNVGFNALQCYSIDNHPTDRNVYIMGLQDNDKYLRRTDGSWHHYPNAFGDGMEMLIYPGNNHTAMGANYYGGAVRITEDAGANWYFLRTYQGSNNGIPDDERGAWIVPFMLNPNSPNTLYLMVQDLYRTTYTPGLLPTWTKIINFPDDYAPQNLEKMAITGLNTGTQNLVGFAGRYSQTNGWLLNVWTSGLDGTGATFRTLPQSAWVNAVAGDPNDANTIWIGYSNIATGLAAKPRVYKSTNLGQSWTNMTNNLPTNLPVSAIWIDPTNSNTVVVGTDIGVYRSDNGGASWSFWNDGLPKVVVNDFAYFAPERKLRVGTYGRGIYETSLDGVVATATASSIRDGILGTGGTPANADYNSNSRLEVGDAVGAVNSGRP
jgi:photosystem II stability/assembly factor-like uncharacterized protein